MFNYQPTNKAIKRTNYSWLSFVPHYFSQLQLAAYCGVIRISSMDDEIKLIVSNEANISIEKVNESSTLLGDLKIDGDDAWEVFEQCHSNFQLDLTDFDFNLHFRCEPCLKGFVYLYRKLKYRDEHIAANKIPITVGQLIKACKNGKW